MLVIHPKDKTTAMLSALYDGLEAQVVIDYRTTKEMGRLLHHVSTQERIMLLGHGSDKGLFFREDDSKNEFDKIIVGHSHRYHLHNHGSNIVAVWCNADQFARAEGLHGLFTGMIVSELSEALLYQVETTQEELDRENVKLARRLRTLLDERIPLSEIPKRMLAMDDIHSPLTTFNYNNFYYWRNIFVTHNAFGIFSRYSHIARGSGKPKMSYPTKAVAMKAAKAMSEKHGVHFSVYKCAWCDGWHVGKNAQNKVVQENQSDVNKLSLVNKPNALYEALKRYPIVDLAPVYDKGVRGRTMSGRGSNWLLTKVRDAGVKVIIDLRTADHTDRYDRNVADAGLEYHSLPIDSRNMDVHQIINSLPLLFELMDKGSFYIACAMGRHRTDIAIALYYVMHPSVPFEEVPEMRGHRYVEKKEFRCDDIAARLNSIIKAITPNELAMLGLPADYEAEFLRRKKHLFDVNRKFE